MPPDLFRQFGEFGDAAAGCFQGKQAGVLAFLSFEPEHGPQPVLVENAAIQFDLGDCDAR